MILHIKETALKVKKKHCDVSSRMYYLKFTSKGPKYTRQKYVEIYLWLAFIESCQKTGADLRST